MSALLPVLVNRNSGFEALSSVAFGSTFVIESKDPVALSIQNIWSKDKECRLEEAVTLRDSGPCQEIQLDQTDKGVR